MPDLSDLSLNNPEFKYVKQWIDFMNTNIPNQVQFVRIDPGPPIKVILLTKGQVISRTLQWFKQVQQQQLQQLQQQN